MMCPLLGSTEGLDACFRACFGGGGNTFLFSNPGSLTEICDGIIARAGSPATSPLILINFATKPPLHWGYTGKTLIIDN